MRVKVDGDVAIITPCDLQRRSWKRTLRARKSSETLRKDFEQVGPEQQRRLVLNPEHLERRHVGEGHRARRADVTEPS